MQGIQNVSKTTVLNNLFKNILFFVGELSFGYRFGKFNLFDKEFKNYSVADSDLTGSDSICNNSD